MTTTQRQVQRDTKHQPIGNNNYYYYYYYYYYYFEKNFNGPNSDYIINKKTQFVEKHKTIQGRETFRTIKGKRNRLCKPATKQSSHRYYYYFFAIVDIYVVNNLARRMLIVQSLIFSFSTSQRHV